MSKLLRLILMTLLATAASTLRAEVIDFDDMVDNGTGQLIQNGYHGFQWENFYVLNVQDFSNLTYMGANGYANGVVSGTNVAFNGSGLFGEGAPALVHNGLFAFKSAYFNSAWSDGMSVTVTGKLAGNTVEQRTFTVDASGGPKLEVFDWSGIDELDFSSSGGTHHGDYHGMGAHFSMDNFDVTPLVVETPEPGRVVGLISLSAAGITLASVLTLRRRRTILGTLVQVPAGTARTD